MSNIIIVGLGCVSAMGHGVESLAVLDTTTVPKPTCCFQEPQLKDTKFYQGSLDDSIATSGFELALEACQEALSDSGLISKNIALLIATGAGDTESLEGHDGCSHMPYDIAQKIASDLLLEGVYATVSNACSSAGYALAMADDLLDQGHDGVLLCGVDVKSVTTQATFKSLLVLDANSCRPFSNDREGTVLGSGAAALMLTRKKVAQATQCYAALRGVAISCDAYHPTSPEPSGKQMRRCIEDALIISGILPDQVDLFLPHATGTKLNDEIEELLLSELFPNTFKRESTILLKKYVGHTGGGSAAFSLVVAALRLRLSRTSDYESDSNFVLVNSAAFGGNNSCAVLESVNCT